MKKNTVLILILLIVSILITGCVNKMETAQPEEDKESFKNKESKPQMTINVDDYNYVIPENEKGNALHQEMEESLRLNKELKLDDEPVSIVLYGGFYDEQTRDFIMAMYIFNNTDKEIEDVTFHYEKNFEKIGGKNEGAYKFIYNFNGEDRIIPAKSVVPGIVRSENIVLKDPKKFYTASEIGSFEVSNITIYYADSE